MPKIPLTLLGALGALAFGWSGPLRAGAIIAHEWGTFTCLQDADGQAIGAINVDDEPVPTFVYGVAGAQVGAQYSRAIGNFGLPPYSNGKGWTPGDPTVTMRLETPVLYLYPSPGVAASAIPALDVRVDFRGGVLSQFYPHARQETEGGYGIPLTSQSTSSLIWKGVKPGSTVPPMTTTEKVWTTPREVSAPVLEVSSGTAPNAVVEAEHYLFYRGVGHLDSPLKLIQHSPDASGGAASFTVAMTSRSERQPPGMFAHAWLVEIGAGGAAAFRQVDAFGSEGAQIPGGFAAQDFSAANLTSLKASMQQALVDSGLYPDEASAMLRTWELSYFKSPGLRFFYVVPPAWVDHVLPLQISGADAQLTRVMVGRVELITAAQRAALARLSAGPSPDFSGTRQAAVAALQNKALSTREADSFYRGELPLTYLGIPLSAPVQDYLSLGRFRDALVLHEEAAHPTSALAQLIKDSGFQPNQR